jgi:gamma-glutamylcyclotransferase (GGCT)/AIG2-like uncharacterized protein YtfP
MAPPKDEGTNRLSAMVTKFLAARNDATHQTEPWKPVHYFFYGSLMDEQKLTEVLRLDSTPVLRPASIVGYSIKMWGPYPTLIDGPPGNVVNGMVYEVQKEGHEKRLAYYETKAYRCVSCSIKLGQEESRSLERPLCGRVVRTTRIFRREALILKRGRGRAIF